MLKGFSYVIRFTMQIVNPHAEGGGCVGSIQFLQTGGIPGATLQNEKGRVIALEDAEGHRTELEHDPEVTNSSTITNRLGKPTEYKYDAKGHLSDIIDAYGKITHYVNDARGNVLSETDPLV